MNENKMDIDDLLDIFHGAYNKITQDDPEKKEIVDKMFDTAKDFSTLSKVRIMTSSIDAMLKSNGQDITKINVDTNSASSINSISFLLLINNKEKEAFEYLNNILKENTNAPVHMSLGDMYYYGIGVKKNIDMANKMYLKAIKNCEIENSIIEELSGIYYADGNEAKNSLDAIECFEKSFRYGNITAYIRLGDIKYDAKVLDYSGAYSYYKRAAEQGEEDMKYRPNYDKYHIAQAFNNLGYMIVNSKHTDKYEDAFNYFKKAASLDFVTAFFHVGYMYEFGLGVEKNRKEAIKWFTYAANNNCEEAIYALEELDNNKTK